VCPSFDSLDDVRPTLAELSGAYQKAVRYGQNDVGLTTEQERAERPATLLARGLARMPEVSLHLGLLGAYSIEQGSPDFALPLVRAGRSASAGALRLTHRALELHARDLGYEPGRWLAQVPGGADALLALAHDPTSTDPPRPIQLVRSSTASLLAALLCLESDRMAVPGEASSALSDLLVLYVVFEAADP
jgi:hypothetical protein